MDERTKGRMDRHTYGEKDKYGEAHTRFLGLCELAQKLQIFPAYYNMLGFVWLCVYTILVVFIFIVEKQGDVWELGILFSKKNFNEFHILNC